MSALLTKLERIEMDGRNAPDLRRMVRDARCDLHAAIQSKDRERIAKRTREAQDLLTMWADHVH